MIPSAFDHSLTTTESFYYLKEEILGPLVSDKKIKVIKRWKIELFVGVIASAVVLVCSSVLLISGIRIFMGDISYPYDFKCFIAIGIAYVALSFFITIITLIVFFSSLIISENFKKGNLQELEVEKNHYLSLDVQQWPINLRDRVEEKYGEREIPILPDGE